MLKDIRMKSLKDKISEPTVVGYSEVEVKVKKPVKTIKKIKSKKK